MDLAGIAPARGLIGRDFLAFLRFVYNGPKGEYSLVDDKLRKQAKKKRQRVQSKGHR